jgi:WD40 repeat protein/serine/threonine protein kinase
MTSDIEHDDFADRLVQLAEKMASTEYLTASSRAESIVADDPTLAECVGCLSLLERVRKRRLMREALRDLQSERKTHLPKKIGPFEIQREIGRGGSGIVLLATDTRLHRSVALKVPHPHFLVSECRQRRFLLEAEATARLDHPHIARVFESGSDGPIAYLAAEYCDGPTLASWLDSQRSSVSPRIAAAVVRDLASAAQHAHSHAIIHRDIKPGNAIVVGTKTEQGLKVPVVKLCDFGLAKVLDAESGQTHSGDLLGTPAYMAPEQAEGKISAIDVRSDVYSLGAVLFELLTGRPPYVGETPSTILIDVLHKDVATIRSVRKDIPVDLATIVDKCLARDQKDRFATAQELFEELNRYLTGRPILARPTTMGERLLKWAVRQPAMAAASLLAALLPITLLATSVWFNSTLFEKNREILSRLYVADMRSAKQAIEGARYPEARALLDKYAPSLGTPDVRTFPWSYLAAQSERKEPLAWKCHSSDVYAIDFSSDGTRLATASKDGTAAIWSYPEGKLLHRLLGHKGEVNEAIFSPDNQSLATSGDDGTVRLWDVESGTSRLVISAHTLSATCLAFDKDGRRLASGGNDGFVRVWDVASGRQVAAPIKYGRDLMSLTTSADKSLLYVSSAEPRLECLRLDTLEPVWQCVGAEIVPEKVRTIATVPHSSDILIGTWVGHVFELDKDGRDETRYTLDGGITGLLVMPSGEHFIACSERGTLSYHRRSPRESSVPFFAMRSRIWDILLNSRGSHVLTACADGTIRLVPLPDDLEESYRTISRLDGNINGLSISRDGTKAFVSGDLTLAVIDLASGRKLHERSDFSSTIYCLSVSPDENLLAVGEKSGRVSLWSAADLTPIVEQFHGKGSDGSTEDPIEALLFEPNGTMLLIGAGSQLLHWDWKANTVDWQRDLGYETIRDLALSSDQRLIAACRSGLVLLEMERDRWSEIGRYPTTEVACRAAWIPSTNLVNIGFDHGLLEQWDLQKGNKIRQIQIGRRRNIEKIACNSTGEYMVCGAAGEQLFIVNSQSLQVQSATVVHGCAVNSAQFSPDGKTIYAGVSDGRLISRPLVHSNNDLFIDPSCWMSALSLSPDQKLISVMHQDIPAKFFSISPMARQFIGTDDRWSAACFSSDAKRCFVVEGSRIEVLSADHLKESAQLIADVGNPIMEIGTLPDERLLVRTMDDSFFVVSSRAPHNVQPLWKADGVKVERAAMSPSGSWLALGLVDRELLLVNLEDGEVRVAGTCSGLFRSLAFSPDDRWVAAGSEHGTIFLLDVKSGRWTETMHYSENVVVVALAFADGGRTLMSASSEGGLQFWDFGMREILFSLDIDKRFSHVTFVKETNSVLACGGGGAEMGFIKIYRGSLK